MLKLMVYFCYIHRESGGAPYFEVLAETSQSGAMARAQQMLSQHDGAVRAEVWEGERLVFSLPRALAGGAAESRPPPDETATS
ncbi:hypothetical protein [Phenylobacterium sp.]|uniref:hypothetical protein n=1 Tax=Phenylobacterium sp. TaxID=1871053 RepID=UPI003569893D